MRQEKMQIKIIPSKVMDGWAKDSAKEHEKVRLPKKARKYYKPHEWDKIYITIHGTSNQKKLRIGQAPQSELQKRNKRDIGFVTTKTYNYLMGKTKTKNIWVSEEAEPLTLGCDPEFVLVKDSGEAQYARDVLPFVGSLGSDGPCAELRPDPTTDVEELVTRLTKLLKTDSTKIEEFRWVGGATFKHENMPKRFPIGGHIHFGLPNIPGAAKNTNFDLQKAVIRVLDELVGIPLVRIDTPLPKERRLVLGYGAFGPPKDNRGLGTYKMEYRNLSGIWLVHPEIAQAVLGTAKAVVEEVWKRYTDRDHKASFMLNTGRKDNILKSFECHDSELIRRIFNSSNIPEVKNDLINNIYSRLRKMSTYPKYKDHVDNLNRICKMKNMPPASKKLELRRGWLENKTL